MGRFRFPWTEVPDDGYVAKLRKGMQFWNRWRYLMLTANVGLVVAAVWLIESACRLLMQNGGPAGNQPINLPLMGFASGVIVGMLLSGILMDSLHGLTAAIGGMQSERLLLKYYDAYCSGHPAGGTIDVNDDDCKETGVG